MNLSDGRFKLGTFTAGEGPAFGGLVLDGGVLRLDEIPRFNLDPDRELPTDGSIAALLNHWDKNFSLLRRIAGQIAESDRVQRSLDGALLPLERLKPHLPAGLPRQILCTGANYKKHVVDLIVEQGAGVGSEQLSPAERRAMAEKMMDERAATGSPYMFSKLASALTGPVDEVVLPAGAQKADWELELAVVIGRPARRVRRDEAFEHIAGYTIANDLTIRENVFRRDMKAVGTDWVASKCAPRSSPVGPYIVPAAFLDNPQDLRITLKLNGDTMQNESTSDMLFDVPRLVEYASAQVELWPGDLVLTGSPAGNGSHYNRFLCSGDVMEGSITGLGTQRNLCVVGN